MLKIITYFSGTYDGPSTPVSKSKSTETPLDLSAAKSAFNFPSPNQANEEVIDLSVQKQQDLTIVQNSLRTPSRISRKSLNFTSPASVSLTPIARLALNNSTPKKYINVTDEDEVWSEYHENDKAFTEDDTLPEHTVLKQGHTKNYY